MEKIQHLVVATRNLDKLREINAVLNETSIKILSMHDFPDFPEVEEDGETLEENAIKKAREIQEFAGLPALADDTGLEVDALSGKPGVYSSRFAGELASYDDNVKKLLNDLQEVPELNRGAQFRTVIALQNNKKVWTVEGTQTGEILFETKGSGGFGYDPVFFVPEYQQTFAEMTLDLKNQISHRGKALVKIKKMMVEHFDEVFL